MPFESLTLVKTAMVLDLRSAQEVLWTDFIEGVGVSIEVLMVISLNALIAFPTESL